MADYTPRAAESGHWYAKDGKPVYEVLGADGKKMVTPDTRHARKLGLLPGATTIIGCADKPGLTVWKIEQSILSSMTLPRRPHEPDAEFIKRVIEDSQEQGKKAAEEGERIHAAIERFIGKRQYDLNYADHIVSAMAQISKIFPAADWQCEGSFGSPLGFGGKIDLDDPASGAMGDIKSKDFSETPSPSNRVKLHWDEHVMQLAAYKMGKYNSLDGPAFNLFVSRTVKGLSHFHMWEREDLERGWEMFKALLSFWQARQKYQSGWIP